MQEDRARIERLDAEIARYEADLERRKAPEIDPISTRKRLASGLIGAAMMCLAGLPLGLAVITLGGGARVWIMLWGVCMTLLPMVGFLQGFKKGSILAEFDFGTAASRKLEARDKELDALRARPIEQHRDRLVAQRAKLIESLEDQVGGGLSISEDAEQQGKLTVSEDSSAPR